MVVNKKIICFILSFFISFNILLSLQPRKAYAFAPAVPAVLLLTTMVVGDVAYESDDSGYIADAISSTWDSLTVTAREQLFSIANTEDGLKVVPGRLWNEIKSKWNSVTANGSNPVTTFNNNYANPLNSFTVCNTTLTFKRNSETSAWWTLYKDNNIVLNGDIITIGNYATNVMEYKNDLGKDFITESSKQPIFYAKAERWNSTPHLGIYVKTYNALGVPQESQLFKGLDIALGEAPAVATSTEKDLAIAGTFVDANTYTVDMSAVSAYADAKSIADAKPVIADATCNIIANPTAPTSTVDLGIWDWLKNLLNSIYNAICGLGQSIIDGLTYPITAVKTAVGVLGDTLSKSLDSVKTGVLAGVTSIFIPDIATMDASIATFNTDMQKKFGLDYAFLSQIQGVSQTEFKDILFNMGDLQGSGRTDSAVIVSAKFVNQYIGWIRTVTSMMMIFLLLMYIINNILKILRGYGFTREGSLNGKMESSGGDSPGGGSVNGGISGFRSGSYRETK